MSAEAGSGAVGGDPRVIANVGAEEGEPPTGPAAERVRTLARLFASLFVEPGPFDWLQPGEGEATAWWVTAEARERAQRRGLRLRGPDPAVVARVHDKAFCHRTALEARLLPPPLDTAIRVLEPEALADSDAALAAVEDAVSGWPAWLGGEYTLKPRIGTSGRGRVGGRAGGAGGDAVRGALGRLAARGGAVLEPWLARRGDFSTQLHVSPGEPGLTLLGTLRQVVSPPGQVLAHRGTVDTKGRVGSGSPFDAELREAAAAVAGAAREAGYTGPCGVDAFAFETPDGVRLRPAVELNARFTLGIVALVAVRRALRTLKRRHGLRPGMLHHFAFALDAPATGWPAPDAADGLFLDLAAPGEALRPGLWVTARPEPLDRAFPVPGA